MLRGFGMDVRWMFCGCLMDVGWIVDGFWLGVWWIVRGCLMDVGWILDGYWVAFLVDD